VLLLTVVAAVIWCAHYDRWTAESWQIPTDYRGDTLEILARIAAASEGDAAPLAPQVISRLGAPFGANWSAYPSSDLVLVWAIGQLARVVGLFTAANIALLLATVTAALAFYGCARWLRARWEWAFAGALLFAYTGQTFHRGLPHLFLLFSWTVPLALLVCGFVATSRRLELRAPMGLFCVVTAGVIGLGNPYTLFLFLQLLGWAIIAQWLGARRRDNLIVGAVALAVAIAAFAMTESHLWLFAPDTAASSPLVRNYGSTERYALKPLELFLPPATHRWEALAFFGHRYTRWSEWRGGEAFLTYLGIVGIAGIVWLAVTALLAVLRRQRLPAVALPAGWVVAFSSVGGVTNIVAFFTGLVIFRATNRFSIFLSAIALLFIANRMTRLLAGRSRWISFAAAAVVGFVGVLDQLPRPPGPEKQLRIAERIAQDRELGKLLEGRLPAGAMVFQLPVMGFPEVAPAHTLGDYELFRPYLVTHSVRFSYGILKGRSRGRWQRDAETLPTAAFVEKLERAGFAALYINRRGFADAGEKLLSELAAIGRSKHVDTGHAEHVVVFLEPARRPEPPMARTFTFGQGWHNAAPGEPRWAHGRAALSYYNPRHEPLCTKVRFVLSGVGQRNLEIRVNGEPSIGTSIVGERKELNLNLTLQPGFNRIDLEAKEPAVRLSHQPGQLRSFAVHEASIAAAD
jgi:phosphoglycerol transferase